MFLRLFSTEYRLLLLLILSFRSMDDSEGKHEEVGSRRAGDVGLDRTNSRGHRSISQSLASPRLPCNFRYSRGSWRQAGESRPGQRHWRVVPSRPFEFLASRRSRITTSTCTTSRLPKWPMKILNSSRITEPKARDRPKERITTARVRSKDRADRVLRPAPSLPERLVRETWPALRPAE